MVKWMVRDMVSRMVGKIVSKMVREMVSYGRCDGKDVCFDHDVMHSWDHGAKNLNIWPANGSAYKGPAEKMSYHKHEF